MIRGGVMKADRERHAHATVSAGHPTRVSVRRVHSWGCNTAAARHHERTCIDMDVVVAQAAFPHIFDQQVFRKALILDIGVCIMEEK